MKLITFAADGEERVGALCDEKTVSDLTAAGAPWFANMLALIDGGQLALDEARNLTERPKSQLLLADVKLMAPLPAPRQMYDCLTFERHIRDCGRYAHLVTGGPQQAPRDEIPSVYREFPVYYKCNRFSVIGTETDIIRPPTCRFLDFELELGMVLGRGGKDITIDSAPDHIFGYCIFNDVTARDLQFSEMRGGLGPAKGKDFDTGNVLGPWLVTADEIEDASKLRMRAWVNGELLADGDSGEMLHDFPAIIAHVSRDETHHAGEFFGSGTVGGGCGLEHGRFLQSGDVVELEISGLGRLRNRITAR